MCPRKSDQIVASRTKFSPAIARWRLRGIWTRRIHFERRCPRTSALRNDRRYRCGPSRRNPRRCPVVFRTTRTSRNQAENCKRTERFAQVLSWSKKLMTDHKTPRLITNIDGRHAIAVQRETANLLTSLRCRAAAVHVTSAVIISGALWSRCLRYFGAARRYSRPCGISRVARDSTWVHCVIQLSTKALASPTWNNPTRASRQRESPQSLVCCLRLVRWR